MSKKQMNFIWGISLVILGIATLIISISALVDAALPDILRRCLGVLELISLFALAYTSIKLKKENAKR